jgi:hypothetical protein
MKRILTFTTLVFSLVATTCYADWARVESITLNGVNNAIPGGSTIHRDYPPGLYRFSLDTASIGISYAYNYPKSTSAFIMLFDYGSTPGKVYSKSLSLEDGPSYIDHASNASANVWIGAEFFVEDWNIWDNTGSVRVFVDKWK